MDSKEKLERLFEYIKKLYESRFRVTTDVTKQVWYKFIDEIPADRVNILVNYSDRVGDDPNQVAEIPILQISKPDFKPCPQPPKEIKNWLDEGWESFLNDIRVIKLRKKAGRSITFKDDELRVKALENWNREREAWRAKQYEIHATRRFFEELYDQHISLDRDAETLELMVGQGLIECLDATDNKIYHPILLKRLQIEFDAQENILYFVDTNVDPELYSSLLQDVDYVNHNAIKELDGDLKENFYHPLDRIDTPDYLKRFIHQMNSKGRYLKPEGKAFADDKIVLRNRPVFFVRKRQSGVLGAIEGIIEQIKTDDAEDTPLLNLVGEREQSSPEVTEPSDIGATLAALGGEDKEILLSKEANKEQLEIAKRIEQHDAVLVQGPPGTGKTHTIANLMGHFLAQGKNILVTSHTRKALSVVKEKVPEEIQNLCVSVLSDNNRDMERSVDGITDYLSRHSMAELGEKIKGLKTQRDSLMDEIAEVREKVYNLKFKEYQSIVIDGQGYNPSEAARFVFENQETCSWIPGKVALRQNLPVTQGELELLYKTNDYISKSEENELICELPNPVHLLTPEQYNELCLQRERLNADLEGFKGKLSESYSVSIDDHTIYLDGNALYHELSKEELELLLAEIRQSNIIADLSEDWCFQAVLAGRRGGGYRQVWGNLIALICQTNEFAESIVVQNLGKVVSINGDLPTSDALVALEQLRGHLAKKNKVNKMALVFHPNWKNVLELIEINGKKITTQKDCEIVLNHLRLTEKREELGALWDELIAKGGGPKFSELGNEPEQLCLQRIPRIEACLQWDETIFALIKEQLEKVGFAEKVLFNQTEFATQFDEIKYLLTVCYVLIPACGEAAKIITFDLQEVEKQLIVICKQLVSGKAEDSMLCQNLAFAAKDYDPKGYQLHYQTLSDFYLKYSHLNERTRILEALKPVAPDWYAQIKNRVDLHGGNQVPGNVKDAWLWKQFVGILDEIAAESFEDLQKRSERLNIEFRKVTTKLIEVQAWYHLMERVENDTEKKQALEGWRLTERKIGRGTGKNAPRLKREAQKLMAKCQSAVPAWIMPINKALETLDPAQNKFDVVIIDEASQSDISALAIMYLAKKIIIVGDDEQVSPSAIGYRKENTNALAEMYIKGVVPNFHLYEMDTSLYDIAKTTFPSLMLKEHFRCVPQIIQYSNKLSYDWKIKPLRDGSSSNLKPATISYRVDGMRSERKVNEVEAETIAALLLACLEQPEYRKSTFGMISLLGDEQALLVDSILRQQLTPLEYANRKILCGNASHFQGDERDVIFLSLVDSNQGDGPLRRTREGSGGGTKKRYNVAASRARDQLWLVHSLDPEFDLQADDIRRDLIEYMSDPESILETLAQHEAKAESPFEKAVIRDLVSRNYHIVPQWEAGAYRIDIVVLSGDKKIAVECDGDRFHSGEEKLIADLERQAVLERLGWRFIRIRGSEYYRNPAGTMERVVSQLSEYEIFPETAGQLNANSNDSDLKERVVARASNILGSWKQTTENKQISLLRTAN